MADLEELFASCGTRFITPLSIVEQKLDHVRSFLFDWDGVFNNGTKGHEVTSHFTEADSMGVNMLRFSHWLKHGEIPYCAIITGRNNVSAEHFARREHFHAVYMGYTNKQESLDEGAIDPSISAFFFDDILDLTVAAQCQLRVMISRDQSPLTTKTVVENNWCEILTGSTGGSHALREACELLIGLNGNWDEVIDSRVAYNESYRNYLEARNSTETKVHEKSR